MLLNPEWARVGNGLTDDYRYRRVLCPGDCLRRRVRQTQIRQTQVEVLMNLENFWMLLISFALMVYLIYALLRPEKF